jgi:glutaredoxin
VHLTILIKERCPLCEQALAVLGELQEEIGFELEAIDIASDPELGRTFRFAVPVIRVDGEEWARHRVDAEFERRLLERATVPESL